MNRRSFVRNAALLYAAGHLNTNLIGASARRLVVHPRKRRVGDSVNPTRLSRVKDFPYLWQQGEYVLGGSSNYMFLVPAADQVLSAK